MIKYTVKVYASGDKYWFLEDKLHREDGPAIEYADGYKAWYLEDKEYIEEEYLKKMNPKPTCEGKVIKVDGIKYKLMKE